MHGASKTALRDSPRSVATGRYEHRGAGHGAGQHLRLIPGSLDARQHTSTIANNYDTSVDNPPRVSPAQNRRALAHVDQHERHLGRERRLAAAANGEIADADNRSGETPPQMRPVLVVAPACARDSAVEKVQQVCRRVRRTGPALRM